MSRRWLALVATVALFAATAFAPQAACAAPAGSIESAMACCRTMKRCTTAGRGHQCCRQVGSNQEQSAPPAISASLPAGSTMRALGTCALQVITTGEPSARLATIVLMPTATLARGESPPGLPVPIYLLLNTLLI